jgi:hypothetical protein
LIFGAKAVPLNPTNWGSMSYAKAASLAWRSDSTFATVTGAAGGERLSFR